eukprot:gnl/TRDRNA2_/TRDRNA2_134753_c1_seq1.p1 gnl/TRDRNA2_/TRDRNA2_134753_c1~~gnl/TRDRNA2_/TRDRNA2_134753_c1_seq1.p1  ORF type:complete len:527 (-),score=66.17 gnl/TRDRNA2_/TRDRNA2_134753_c1_seq1:81-1550(-)
MLSSTAYCPDVKPPVSESGIRSDNRPLSRPTTAARMRPPSALRSRPTSGLRGAPRPTSACRLSAGEMLQTAGCRTNFMSRPPAATGPAHDDGTRQLVGQNAPGAGHHLIRPGTARSGSGASDTFILDDVDADVEEDMTQLRPSDATSDLTQLQTHAEIHSKLQSSDAACDRTQLPARVELVGDFDSCTAPARRKLSSPTSRLQVAERHNRNLSPQELSLSQTTIVREVRETSQQATGITVLTCSSPKGLHDLEQTDPKIPWDVAHPAWPPEVRTLFSNVSTHSRRMRDTVGCDVFEQRQSNRPATPDRQSSQSPKGALFMGLPSTPGVASPVAHVPVPATRKQAQEEMSPECRGICTRAKMDQTQYIWIPSPPLWQEHESEDEQTQLFPSLPSVASGAGVSPRPSSTRIRSAATSDFFPSDWVEEMRTVVSGRLKSVHRSQPAAAPVSVVECSQLMISKAPMCDLEQRLARPRRPSSELRGLRGCSGEG